MWGCATTTTTTATTRVLTLSNVYGKGFPISPKDVIGHPDQILTVHACSGEAKFWNIYVSGWPNLSVKSFLEETVSSAKLFVAKLFVARSIL